jgi:hypothetical protein
MKRALEENKPTHQQCKELCDSLLGLARLMDEDSDSEDITREQVRIP